MNERIRELIAKSTWVQFVEGVGHKEVFDKEQFAELIVKECTNMVEEHQPRYLTRRQAQEMADTIREHFGVEE